MTVNEELRAAQIKHSVYMQRYTTGTNAKLIALLNRVDADLFAQLMRMDKYVFSSPLSIERIDRLLESVRVINREAYNSLGRELTAELTALATHEAGFQAEIISASIPVAVDLITPTTEQLYAAVNSRPFQGKLLSEWLDGLEAGRAAQIRDAVRMGVVEGQTIQQIVQRIKGTRALSYTDGLMDISRRGAEAMIRTAVNHTTNSARDAVYGANSSVIKGVQWVSTLDARTSSVCQSRDGHVYPVDSGPRPPAHINCRSCTAPVLKSWKEIGLNLNEFPEGTRASMNGQVAESETYQTWLTKQSASFQDDVLGASKGKLFRDGGMSLDRFIDKSGKTLTLAELKLKDAAAFKRAGL